MRGSLWEPICSASFTVSNSYYQVTRSHSSTDVSVLFNVLVFVVASLGDADGVVTSYTSREITLRETQQACTTLRIFDHQRSPEDSVQVSGKAVFRCLTLTLVILGELPYKYMSLNKVSQNSTERATCRSTHGARE